MVKYRGKVTKVGRNYLTVVLFHPNGEEVVGEFSKDVFPSAGQHVGQIFDYSFTSSSTQTSLRYKLVPEQDMTKKDIQRLAGIIKRSLKKGLEDI